MRTRRFLALCVALLVVAGVVFGVVGIAAAQALTSDSSASGFRAVSNQRLWPFGGPALPEATASASSNFSYWYASAQYRVYPTSAPPSDAGWFSGSGKPSHIVPKTLALSAARSEYEGRQLCIQASGGALQDVWIQPSDLAGTDASGNPVVIPASNVSVFKVGYVNVPNPSYGYSYKGPIPDPLLPMTLANGQRLGWNADGSMTLSRRGVSDARTQPFYVLFHVPESAVRGNYSGTLKVTCRDATGRPLPELVVPVRLTVWPFSVAARTLKTAFGLKHSWSTNDQANSYLRYMSEHRLSPETLEPAWGPMAGDGTISGNRSLLDDYLHTGAATNFSGERMAFNTVKMPAVQPGTSWFSNPFGSSSDTNKAKTYYQSMKSVLGADLGKAYVYPIDEPTYAMRSLIIKYAAFIHRYVPGVKFLLTTDATTEKGKLLPGVDIYVYKLHFAFRDSAWTKAVSSAHKDLWIYSHATNWSVKTPALLLDAPLTDGRTQSWCAWKLRAKGLLYFAVNKTQPNKSPYLDPGSVQTYLGHPWNDNGTLIYPGYEPKVGLPVLGSPPVGSLRVEALRDGLEDYEYLTQVAARYGTSTADANVMTIVGKVPAQRGGILTFPPYSKRASDYDAVRSKLAAMLSK